MPNLTNNFSQPVIAEDQRDPYVSWAAHRARGSLGGVDLAYPEGTDVASICDGWCEPVGDYGTGGNTMRVHLDDGSYVEFMHLSSFARGYGDRVTVGDIIGQSGHTGGDYAPHLHVHVYVNGTRCNVWDYFGAGSSSIAQPSASAIMSDVMWSGEDWSFAQPIGNVAASIQADASTLGFYNRDDGSARPADGDWGEFSRKAVQLILCDSGTFCGDIDGKIWRGGCYGIQDFAAAWGNYTALGGVRDGAPRALSWACFAEGLHAYVASKQAPASTPVVEPAPVPEEATSVSDAAFLQPDVSEPAPQAATEEQPVESGASDATPTQIPTVIQAASGETIREIYRPINEGDTMVLQEAIPTVTVADGALGEIIDSPKARRQIYSVWVVIGLTLQALTGGVIAGAAAAVAAVAAGWSFWLVVGVAVFAGIAGAYVALTPQVATLARANVKK